MASSERKYFTPSFPNGTINRTMPYIKDSNTKSTVIDIEKDGQNELPRRSVSREDLYVFGIPLDGLSKPLQMAICCGGVLLFYLVYGYVQEWIFRIEGFKPYGWYLTLVQFGFYSLFGTIQKHLGGENTRKIPLKTYAGLAFLTVSTMGLSNTSLGYLNYPTQVIFKSCKLIPVMIGGILIQGKKYGPLDFVACLCMSIGLILFTLADSKVQPDYNNTGVILISLALLADAVIGNVQEKAMKSHNSSNSEVVLYSYGIGFLYILFGLLVTGQLWDAFLFSSQKPIKIYSLAFLFSISGYLGISFVLMLVRIFGALTAVTITTFRKAVTMVLSFMFFSKPFTIQYLWSGFIVFFGIFLNVYSKNQAKMNDLFYSYARMLSTIFRGQRAVKPTTPMQNV
ncbi:adenosine 3'-phospho 5'-phosphosulfate transporter 2-like [Actinia tenebrosa]|uniref:Adenosine 3'-phospho 5'-phosphosulfate transporter 2 n=1 Tax=Actinia tenebrosa TaxID=6105 RepID=A0A6P8J4D1_ACTTE|nr:adenosine 3'-phospho 5'-phosphosulfate transporter 2-like [Actinia tenebrosa]